MRRAGGHARRGAGGPFVRRARLAASLRVGIWLALASRGVEARLQDQARPEAVTEHASASAEPLRSLLLAARERVQGGDREGARALLRTAVDELRPSAPGGEAARVAALFDLATLADELGSLHEGKRLREALLQTIEGLPGVDPGEIVTARANIATSLVRLGEIEKAHEILEQVLTARRNALAPGHPDLLVAMQNLAVVRRDLGDLPGAQALEEEVLAARMELLSPDDPDVLRAMQNLAVTIKLQGGLDDARALEEEVLAGRLRRFPTDHGDVLMAKHNLATTLEMLGDLSGARALQEEVLAARRRLLPPAHPDLLQSMQNLATTMRAQGDLDGARALQEEELASASDLPPDHRDVLAAKENLALILAEQGELERARELQEEILEVFVARLPPGHHDLLAVEENVGSLRFQTGDLDGARALWEGVLASRTRLPLDHPDLLRTKQNLAGLRWISGDLLGALVLNEEVCAARERTLPPDHPDLLTIRQNLALNLESLDNLPAALRLLEDVVAALERALPADHPDLARTRLNLAASLHRLGDYARAEALEEQVLALRERTLGPDHPDLIKARGCLAGTLAARGRLEEARALEREALASCVRALPIDHPDRLMTQQSLAQVTAALGDAAEARRLLGELLAGVRAHARALRASSTRVAAEGVRSDLARLASALSLAPAVDPEGTLTAELFATLESLRLASRLRAQVARELAGRPELQRIAREAARARSRLNDLVAAGPEPGAEEGAWRASFLGLVEERDRLDAALRSGIGDAALLDLEIDALRLGAALPPRTAALSYLRHAHTQPGELEPGADVLVAFLLRSDGSVARFDLGPAADVEELVLAWRAALERPLLGRGVGTVRAAAPRSADVDPGERLRRRVLDPVLSALDAREVADLIVVPDDALLLLPLDALPLDGRLVGDRFRIRTEPALARLLLPLAPPAGEPALVALGGIDFDAALGGPAAGDAAGADARAATPEREPLALLPATEAEVRSVGALFRDAFGREARTLAGAEATKAALFALAPGARYLHVATHGWSSAEASLAEGSGAGGGERLLRQHDILVGFAPETLCGLALAGANRGRDALGRVPGILTAEELATLDLRGCRLAVLSACDTNAGVRRAGQGLHSLQAALHAAGCRTAITSLWSVEDATARRFFELFYEELWRAGRGPADALWQAKTALRAEGHAAGDWAGWVLSGDPD